MEATKVLSRAQNVELLEKLGGDKLWKWFLFVTETPHPSGATAALREKIEKVVGEMGYSAKTDATGNLCVHKPASEGKEECPAVIVQCHLDMVPANDEKVVPNYDPLKTVVQARLTEERPGWIVSSGTSLGADDGIGIATCLALLEEKDLCMPPLELVFTVDEETTMEGATNLDVEKLLTPCKGGHKYLINVDSEDDGKLCLGSAGGEQVKIEIEDAPTEAVAEDEKVFQVVLSGFMGGHTGCEAEKYRANATKIMARLLRRVKNVRIAVLEGGLYDNAIPLGCTAVVAVPAAEAGSVKKTLEDGFELFKADYAGVEDKNALAIAISEPEEKPAVALTAEVSQKILLFWMLCPCMPTRMSPDMPGLVETSMSFSICRVKAGKECYFQCLPRTSRDASWDDIDTTCQALADLVGGKMTIFDKFCGWLPQPASELAKVAEAGFQRVAGRACEVYSVHAGLECGMIIEKIPGLQAISIGPLVTNPHTFSEGCKISTVGEYYAWVVDIITHL